MVLIGQQMTLLVHVATCFFLLITPPSLALKCSSQVECLGTALWKERVSAYPLLFRICLVSNFRRRQQGSFLPRLFQSPSSSVIVTRYLLHCPHCPS
ncbi:hypothetical protein QBC37DRAFT_409215 [Rhypophila decipiens]|uniref:Secreted protein n=1 Tax=Rhypophila decipiens TaxID=261697 RepID=A0AAN7BD46_9PEZI|nr:hypothetical protein QBC37DRAFT_409215 [Rhypophila decipiens]